MAETAFIKYSTTVGNLRYVSENEYVRNTALHSVLYGYPNGSCIRLKSSKCLLGQKSVLLPIHSLSMFDYRT